VKRHIGLNGAQLLLLRASTLEAIMVTMIIAYYIHMPNETPCAKSQNDFCSFRRVIWLLAQCFKLLSFFII